MSKYVKGPIKIESSSVTHIMDAEGSPVADIYLGRFTPGMYSVMLRRGLETFVCNGDGSVMELDTATAAAHTVDIFFDDCGAEAAIKERTTP